MRPTPTEGLSSGHAVSDGCKLVQRVYEPKANVAGIVTSTLGLRPLQLGLKLDRLQFEAHCLICESSVRLCHAP